jgi:hypothetical protein
VKDENEIEMITWKASAKVSGRLVVGEPIKTPEDIAEYMSLEEIKEYLLEDEELTDEERFDLYYEEHRRVEDKKDSISYEDLLKSTGIKPSNWKPKKK